MNKFFLFLFLTGLFTSCLAQDSSKIILEINNIKTLKKWSENYPGDFAEFKKAIFQKVVNDNPNQEPTKPSTEPIYTDTSDIPLIEQNQSISWFDYALLVLCGLNVIILLLKMLSRKDVANILSERLNKTDKLIDQLFNKRIAVNESKDFDIIKSIPSIKNEQKPDLVVKLDQILELLNKMAKPEQVKVSESILTKEPDFTTICKANKKDDYIIKADDGEPSLFVIKQDNKERFHLFLSESSKQASSAINGNIKVFFDLEDKKTGEYKLLQPAELEQDRSAWKLKAKGKIEF